MPPSMAVERFADFLLFEELSSHPWGHTFRAGSIHGARVDHHVKLFVFDGAELDQSAFWRLVSERQAIAERVADPHLARLSAIGRAGSTPFAAYHHDPGSTLAGFLAAARARRFPIPADQALFIIERIALALRAAFDRALDGEPIVHGFLLPEFVHLSSEGEVRVLGLEIAPGLQRLLGSHTKVRRHLGPEATTGSAATPADDVFSLGLLLAELLMGRSSSTRGAEPAHHELAEAEASADSEPLPAGLRMLLQRSFAPLDERIPNVAEWQRELSRIILEGEYNPTTFNLSFLLHTLVRVEIAAEVETMAAETGILTAESPDAAASPPPDRTPDAPRPSAERPFLSGFLTSFVGALVLLAALFLVRGMTRADGTAPQDAAAAQRSGREVPTAERLVEEPKPRAVGATASDAAGPMEPKADAPPDPAPAEPPGADAENPLSPPDVEALVDTRVRDLEQTLRDEYESQLEELRQRLEAAEAEEPEQSLSTGANDSGAPPTGSLAGPPSSPGSTPRSEIEPPPELEPPVPGPASMAPEQPAPGPPTAEPAAATDGAPAPAEGTLDSAGETRRSTVRTLHARPEDGLPRAPETSTPGAAGGATSSLPPVYDPPRLVGHPRPVYPTVAMRLRREAVLKVRVLIGPDGLVREATLVDGTEAGFGLDQAALAAAERSRWTPASRDGEPVEASAVLTVEFKL